MKVKMSWPLELGLGPGYTYMLLTLHVETFVGSMPVSLLKTIKDMVGVVAVLSDGGGLLDMEMMLRDVLDDMDGKAMDVLHLGDGNYVLLEDVKKTVR